MLEVTESTGRTVAVAGGGGGAVIGAAVAVGSESNGRGVGS